MMPDDAHPSAERRVSEGPPEAEARGVVPMPAVGQTPVRHRPEAETSADPVALALMGAVADVARHVSETGGSRRFDLTALSDPARAQVGRMLGQGEVSLQVRGLPAIAAQESVFAGIWHLTGDGIDMLEVASVPRVARERAFVPQRAGAGASGQVAGPGVVESRGLAQARELLAELRASSAAFRPGRLPHVVDLAPSYHTDTDFPWLDAALGEGAVLGRSRRRGRLGIRSTATRWVWRVQVFNTMDAVIRDMFEVTALPDAVIALAEDLAESARRIEAAIAAIR